MKKTVGHSGSWRDTYYQEFQMTLLRKVGRLRTHLADDMVGYALLWLAANEAKLMAKYATGALLANVVASSRFEDYRRWWARRAGKDVAETVPGPDETEDAVFSLFDAAVADDDQVAECIADNMLMADIYAAIHKHLDPKLARAFICVEMEKMSVNDTADALDTKHYNVSRWVKKAKEQLEKAILEHPEDFGMAA
jgi:RNA polymerase sigma factor (sigma-70 family)